MATPPEHRPNYDAIHGDLQDDTDGSPSARVTSEPERLDIQISDHVGALEPRETSYVGDLPGESLSLDNARMRMWWEEAMARNLKPEGYRNVGVVLIKWADALDELRTLHEVRSFY